MNVRRDFRSFDFLLFIVVAALGIIGIVMIGSATGVNLGGSAKKYQTQQIWFATGLLVMLAASFIDYQFICRFHWLIYGANILLLLGVLAMKVIQNESVLREIRFGSYGIMPSEFSKIFMIIFFAAMIDKYKDRINKIGILSLLALLAAVPFLLIALQPSLSAALVSLMIFVIMLFIGKISYKYIIIVIALAIPLGGFIYYDFGLEEHIIVDKIFRGYQLDDRIKPFLSDEGSDEVTQDSQSIMAIGSGGLNGKGLYKNAVNVPEAENDFIFAIVGAEFGFVGCLVVIGLMFFVIMKCFIVAWRTDFFLGRLIAAGVGGMFAFQVFVNVAVNTGLLPVTGMAFPFLSAGGSPMWINMSLIGLVINVGMSKPKSMFED